MPTEKDFKRLVRTRMKKTGEAYTAARLQLLETERKTDYATVAGMSDAAVSRQTGRSWADWVRALDAVRAAEQPHGQIAAHVASLGTPPWWTQMVAVGYERIRGLRARGQGRGGTYHVTKSATFDVPVATLFNAFAQARTRRSWLPVHVTVRTATPHRSIRMTWDDDTRANFGFVSKGKTRSAVAVGHERLPDKASADAMKAAWAGHFDRLRQLLATRRI
jgi:uncharacterized protein YndB with AHSA1/START domain